DARAERQCLMRRRELVLIVDLAVRRPPSVEPWPVPGRDPFLMPTDDRRRDGTRERARLHHHHENEPTPPHPRALWRVDAMPPSPRIRGFAVAARDADSGSGSRAASPTAPTRGVARSDHRGAQGGPRVAARTTMKPASPNRDQRVARLF